jgi:hypothetical protein
VFCCYRYANFASGVLPNCAAPAVDWVANFAISSRRRSFCFLNLLNLALSPFCDDICPRSSDLFVAYPAEDKSVRPSMHQAADGRYEAQGTLRRNPLQRLRIDCSTCSLATDKMSCVMPAAYSLFRKICHVVADRETWPTAAAVARVTEGRRFGKLDATGVFSADGHCDRTRQIFAFPQDCVQGSNRARCPARAMLPVRPSREALNGFGVGASVGEGRSLHARTLSAESFQL